MSDHVIEPNIARESFEVQFYSITYDSQLLHMTPYFQSAGKLFGPVSTINVVVIEPVIADEVVKAVKYGADEDSEYGQRSLGKIKTIINNKKLRYKKIKKK